jgi:ABC-type antimicrobial peptide transport system permease subunit
MLFQLTSFDPLSMLAVIVLLTVVALLAGWIPARRATKVNPVIALRYE